MEFGLYCVRCVAEISIIMHDDSFRSLLDAEIAILLGK